MGEPLAYFLTWTTYGVWLPGDERGWVDRRRRHGEIVDKPAPRLEAHARALLQDVPVVLDDPDRAAVEAAIAAQCLERAWFVHAVAVRSNHVHLVVTARETGPSALMGQIKNRATRALNGLHASPPHTRWWTKRGSKRQLYTQRALEAAISYVRNQ